MQLLMICCGGEYRRLALLRWQARLCTQPRAGHPFERPTERWKMKKEREFVAKLCGWYFYLISLHLLLHTSNCIYRRRFSRAYGCIVHSVFWRSKSETSFTLRYYVKVGIPPLKTFFFCFPLPFIHSVRNTFPTIFFECAVCCTATSIYYICIDLRYLCIFIHILYIERERENFISTIYKLDSRYLLHVNFLFLFVFLF